ncbi:MAG: transglycosylase domain-containing protein [Aggregatilineales bacterium]
MASVTQMIRRRRRRKSLKREQEARNQIWTWLLVSIGGVAVIAPLTVILGVAMSAYASALDVLPSQEETIATEGVIRPTEIYDSSGRVLLFSVEDPFAGQRTWITLDELPDYVEQATLLMEDPDFLTASRLNVVQVVSKLWDNFVDGPLAPEASLTGRLIHNVALPERGFATVEERAREIAMVGEVNRRYSAEEVLEWHLNTNYYGNQAYGIEAASQIYFGKSARDLSVDEAAMLTAIPTAPQYNPVDDETAARSRQSDVLRRLLVAGFITQTQFETASNANTTTLPNAGQTPLVAPDFAVYSRRQAEIILDSLGLNGGEMVTRGGLRITTTLDLDLYYQSECALRAHLARLAGQSIADLRALDNNACVAADFLPAVLTDGGAIPPDEGAIVILDAETGEIRSMVGTATRAVYQPGPTLHPFVYLDGFITGEYTPATMLLDIPRTFPGAQDGLIYQPANPDGIYRGPINLRDAMAIGLLPPVTQIANARNAGINGVIRRTANPLGINSLTEGVYNLSLLTRGGGVSVLDMTYAYSVFATLGDRNGVVVPPLQPGLRTHDPVAVRQIEDTDGSVLWAYDEAQIERNRVSPFLEQELAYMVNDILSDANKRESVFNQNNVFELNRPVALVNGMTSDGVDDWTIGYTRQMVVGVRMGRDGGGGMTLSPFALEGAAVVWRALIEYAHIRDGLPTQDWQRPANIAEVTVCDLSGGLATEACPRRTEIFPTEWLPSLTTDTYWQVVDINTQTQLRATPNTDPSLVRAEVYFVPPPEAEEWWRANGRRLPPTDFDTVSRPDIFSSAVISLPEAYSYVGGSVDVRGSIDNNGMAYYQLVYSAWDNQSEIIAITGQQTDYIPGTSLGIWDTTGLNNGLYNLQLQVTYEDNSRETQTIQVSVDNEAPNISLTAGEAGQVFRIGQDTVIPIRAIVQDNLQIDRVIFYHNGQEYGIREDCRIAPECGIDWQIQRAGTETFTAVIYDSVGNSAQAEIVVEVVR